MLKYIVKRLLLLIPVLFGVSLIVFFLMRVCAPDPAPIVLGQHATQESMDAWREANGLNDPVVTQYVDFIKGAFTGDLGTSYYTKTPVVDEIMSRFPATVELAIVAIILASVLGIAVGVVSAVHKNSIFDNGGDAAVPGGRLHPHLLAGHHAHHPVLRHPALAAVHRPRQPGAEAGHGDGLHDHRQHSGGGYGGTQRRAAAPGAAGGDLEPLLHGHHRQDDPLQHAGDLKPGLHPHRQGQGSSRGQGEPPARPEKCHAACGHRHRPAAGAPFWEAPC